MNRMTYLQRLNWAIDLLNLLREDAGGDWEDYPATPGNISTIMHWMGRENTGAKNNPLATTWNQKGSSIMKGSTHKVRDYSTRQSGLEATVKTLTKTNPEIARYDNVRVLFRQGTNPDQFANNAEVRKELGSWGTWKEAPGSWGPAKTKRIDAVIESDLESAVISANEGLFTVKDVPEEPRLPGEMPDREVDLGPDDMQLLSDSQPISGTGDYGPNDPRRDREPSDPNETGPRVPTPPQEPDGPGEIADDDFWAGIETPTPVVTGGTDDMNFAEGFFGFLSGDPRATIVIKGSEVNIVDYLNQQHLVWLAEEGMTEQDLALRVNRFIDKWLPTTEWWKTSTPDLRANSQTWYQQGVGEDWGTLNPARRALIEDKRRDIEALVRNAGATYTAEQLDAVAITSYLFDFDETEIRRYLSGQTVYGQTYGDVLTGGEAAAGSEMREILQDIRSIGNQYLIRLPEAGEKELVRRIFTGDLPKENLRTIMQEKARMLYGDSLSDYYDAGGTTEEFLQTYEPVISKLLGRKAQWNGADYSLGQAILAGDRTVLRPWASKDTGVEETAVASPRLQRPFTVREAELAIRMSPEFDVSAFGIAEMSNMLNTVGAGMGAV